MSTKNGGKGTEKPIKVTEAKALAMKVATMLNGKPKPKMDQDGLVERANKGEAPASKLKSVSKKTKEEAKPKVDRVAERLAFIKQNAPTILKAWDALKDKASAAAMNKVLPSTWHNKWVDEVLHLAGVRLSGEKVVTDAVAADKSILKDIIPVRKAEPKTNDKGQAKTNGKSKTLAAREAKEAASVVRFKATEAQAKA